MNKWIFLIVGILLYFFAYKVIDNPKIFYGVFLLIWGDNIAKLSAEEK